MDLLFDSDFKINNDMYELLKAIKDKYRIYLMTEID